MVTRIFHRARNERARGCGTVKLTIDAAKCSGQGRCYTLAPDLLSFDDEGFVTARGTMIDVPPGQEGPPVTPRSGARRERSPSPTTDRRLMSVEERLGRLETAEEARGVLAAYARACDGLDLDAFAAIMDPDVVLTVAGRSGAAVMRCSACSGSTGRAIGARSGTSSPTSRLTIWHPTARKRRRTSYTSASAARVRG